MFFRIFCFVFPVLSNVKLNGLYISSFIVSNIDYPLAQPSCLL